MTSRTPVLLVPLALTAACFQPDAPQLVTDGGSSSDGSTSESPASATTTTSPEPTTGPASSSASTTEVADESSGDGSTTSSSSQDTGDSADGPFPGDTTPPEILMFTPTDGSSQVFEEAIRIVFSEPMNQASVSAAFPAGYDFTWNGAGTEVELGYPFPFEESPSLHQIVVPTWVTDLAGNGLAEPFEVTVVLAALETSTIDYYPSLTGQTVPSGGTGTWFYTGDHPDNQMVYGGISFPLAGLPPRDAILAIRSASFHTQVIETGGNPNDPVLGGFVVDHVEFASVSGVDSAQVLDSHFATLFNPGDIVVGAPVSVDVMEQLDDSWASDADYFQLRVRPLGVDADGVLDTVYLRRVADENDSIVNAGVADPDPANRARVTIEYFL